MNTIKEQATVNVTAKDAKSYEIGFDAGANYVLEQIEKLTSNQNWYAFPKQSYKELKELIKQLKK